MKDPIIHLIALDLDGTVIGEAQQISPRMLQAVAEAQRRGVAVTLATGRSPVSVRPFVDQLCIDVPVICYQGGLIAAPDGRVLHRAVLDAQLAADVIALADLHGWHVNLYRDGLLYLTEFRYPVVFYEALLNPSAQCVPDLYALLDRAPDKIVIVANGNGEEILTGLHMQFDGQVQIVRSHELFVEVNPPGVDKGQGLARLAAHLGVPQSQVMAVGDQDNDAPMIAWAGLGVAMGNASAMCKSVADWIAPPLDQDGAAVAIEDWVLKA